MVPSPEAAANALERARPAVSAGRTSRAGASASLGVATVLAACSPNEPGRTARASADAAGHAGTDGSKDSSGIHREASADSAEETNDARTTDALAPPFPDARPCPWEGWYVSRWVSDGCDTVCVPDVAPLRVPAFRWTPDDTLGAGAERVALDPGPRISSANISGREPTLVISLTLSDGDNVRTVVALDSQLRVLHARRKSYSSTCAAAYGPGASLEGNAGLLWLNSDGSTIPSVRWFTQVLPLERIGELGVTLDGRFTWPSAEHRGANEVWLSSRLVAVDFTGDVALGDLTTGTSTYARELPGMAPGQYAYASLIGGTAFLKRSAFGKGEWWVWDGTTARHLVGDAAGSVNADKLATDGEHLVWKETREVAPGSYEVKVFASPYTTDAAALQRRLVLDAAPLNFWELRVAHGWLVGTYEAAPPSPANTAIVIRLSDGRALTTPNRLTGVAYPGSDALYTIVGGPVRIPYTSMTVLQDRAPDP